MVFTLPGATGKKRKVGALIYPSESISRCILAVILKSPLFFFIVQNDQRATEAAAKRALEELQAEVRGVPFRASVVSSRTVHEAHSEYVCYKFYRCNIVTTLQQHASKKRLLCREGPQRLQ